MRLLLSLFSPKLPIHLVYMLQQVEYEPGKFISWLRSIDATSPGLTKIMHRQTLDYTKRAKALILAGYLCFLLPVVIGIVIFVLWGASFTPRLLVLIGLIILAPVALIVGLAIITSLAYRLIARPHEQKLIAKSQRIFVEHKAIKIVVAGSYGKTTMKELLTTVLSDKLKVASTPGNKNTSVSHARFAQRLEGDEEILIIEYGEGKPGDVESFAKTTQPDYAVITGLAPNHLDHYKSIGTLAGDIFSLRKFVAPDKLFIADNSDLIHKYIKPSDVTFSDKSALGYKVSSVKLAVTGTSFVITKSKMEVGIHSGLLGRHQVAPLALVTALALDLGMKKSEVERAVAQTIPFEHRMKPYQLGGAWIIDDTYNGNLEGIRAGLNLLKDLLAKQKVYVTPGLVDQGAETEKVHQEIAELIIKAKPDKLILMDNSATRIIKQYLDRQKYTGDITVESDPLSFYQNLDQFVAIGDLVMMQNDWTDNYI